MESLIHDKFRSGTDNPKIKNKYYLINNKVFLGTDCPKMTNFPPSSLGKKVWNKCKKEWSNELVLCEKSESELKSIIEYVFKTLDICQDSISNYPTLDITDIIKKTENINHKNK